MRERFGGSDCLVLKLASLCKSASPFDLSSGITPQKGILRSCTWSEYMTGGPGCPSGVWFMASPCQPLCGYFFRFWFLACISRKTEVRPCLLGLLATVGLRYSLAGRPSNATIHSNGKIDEKASVRVSH